MSKKIIEMTLQDSLLWYLNKNYLALVSTIKITWKDKTTDLQDKIFRVIRYIEINKDNDKDIAQNANLNTNALAVNTQ